MDEKGKQSPERGDTDEGLRRERENADRALAERNEDAEENADAVVQRAREAADAVLNAAREEADDKHALSAASQSAMDLERASEDRAVFEDRATADSRLAQEREETAHALMRLLPLERQRTDRHLLTERVGADKALSNRDDFLGIVSHDLRDLVGGIVMSASLLEGEAAGKEEGERTLVQTDRILRYAARMNKLIGDLLDVASIEAGRLAVFPAPADAALLLAEAGEMFRDTASTKGISLEVEDVDQHLIFDFDYSRLVQVFANLISNAMKFTPEGGRISVHGKRIGDAVLLSVADTGSGIPGHLLEAIFEHFWQADGHKTKGVGLGLYISRSIVAAHGGRIWAESTQGTGSTLYVSLPAVADANTTRAA